MAAGFRTIILAGFAVGGVGGGVLPEFNDNVVRDRSVQSISVNAEQFSAVDPLATAAPGPADADMGQARTERWDDTDSREITVADRPPTRAPETAPVQLAAQRATYVQSRHYRGD